MRNFESKLWDSWNGTVLKRAEDFMERLNNVCAWGAGLFMESVVENLREVAERAEEKELPSKQGSRKLDAWSRQSDSSFYEDSQTLSG